MNERIEVGYQAFLSHGQEEFGAIRDISKNGLELTIYVENAGDFVVPMRAVVKVQSKKVVFDCKRLPRQVQQAIGHAHDAET